MITEDYVSFETAKLLKEKGFPQEYDRYHSLVYNEKDYEDEYEVQRMVLETRLVKAGTLSSYPVGVPEPKCYCPTLQMAMKWLREVHHLFIGVEPRLSFTDYYWITNVYRVRKKNSLYHAEPVDDYSCVACCDGDSFEDACESAIKYCLEKLI